MTRAQRLACAVESAELLACHLRALGLEVQARLADDMAQALISIQLRDAERALHGDPGDLAE